MSCHKGQPQNVFKTMGSDPSERLKAALQYIFDDSNLDDMKELVREGSGINTLTLKRTLLPRCSFDIFPMKDITTLHFSKNRLGPQAFNFLMLALAKAPAALTHVDASSNMATHECCASIADAISSTKTIRWLNLSDNPLTTSAAESVGGSLKANRWRLVWLTQPCSGCLFHCLAGHPLESLDVSGNVCWQCSSAGLCKALSSRVVASHWRLLCLLAAFSHLTVLPSQHHLFCRRNNDFLSTRWCICCQWNKPVCWIMLLSHVQVKNDTPKKNNDNRG